jgi:protocatechuate 3,4-dioxygenase beta subunit
MTRTIRIVAWLVVAAALVWWLWPGAGDGGEAVGEARGTGPGPALASVLESGELRRIDLLRADRAVISGHVRDPQGRGIGGATVCAGAVWSGLSEAERDARHCVTSEGDGGYRIEGLLPVRHYVHASAPRFVPGRYEVGRSPTRTERVLLLAGRETRDVDITLKGGGVEVTGFVRDLSGGELEGALVWSSYAYARSGAEGRFSLWVEPGNTSVRARAEGYVESNAQGVAPGHVFEIYLTPESVLVGRVVRAEDGAPVAGASVYAREGSGFNGGGPAITDEGGNFRVEGLRPGAYRAEAYDDEAYGASAESAVLGLGETSAPVIVTAHPAYLLEGTVEIAGGGVCEEGWLRLEEKAKAARWAPIEPGGLVRVRGVLPGTYDIKLGCDDMIVAERYDPVAVVDASIRGLRWEVRRGRSIRGRVVTAQGDGVAGAWARAEAKPDPSAPRAQTTQGFSNTTEADGVFEMHGLLPGRYEVYVSAEEHPAPEAPVAVTLSEGQDLEDIRITLPATGELRGVVKDSNGSPVKGAEVRLTGERYGLPWTRSADDGTFRLAHVPAGSFRVGVARGWKPIRAPGTTDDDVQGTAVTIAVGAVSEVELLVEAQGGRITGRVIDADGGPLVDAFIDASRESDSGAAAAGGALRQSRWASIFNQQSPRLTDQDGRFELTGLSEGKYTLVAQRRGGGEGTVEHVVTGSDVEIRLADPGSVAGTVRLVGGGAPQQFTVSLDEPQTGWSTSSEFFRTGGVFRFPEVPKGEYKVVVESSEGSSEAKTSVGEGGRGEVQIELVPRVTVRGKVVDLETGAPVAGMKVDVQRPGASVRFYFTGEGASGSEVTDEQGRFEVEKVPAGDVQVSIMPKDWNENGYGWSSVRTQVAASGASVVELPAIKLARKRVGEDEMAGDLGFKLMPAAPDAKPAERRMVVGVVRPGGPASQAGLQVGDEIVRVDGHDVTGENSYLYASLTAVKAGAKVRLGLLRGELEVTAGKPL